MNVKIKAILVVLLFALGAVFVAANPVNPNTLTEGATSRYNLDETGKSVTAYAGNVTQVDIDGTSITDGWQGYYGNVTGNIVLGNSNNDTLYEWNFTTITGEVYATETASPTWGSVVCANATTMNDSESGYGMGETDTDGVNETFTGTQSVTIGTSTLSNCPSATMNDGNFVEALLYDGSTNLIFTAIINDDGTGFDTNAYDYEMIVGENAGAGTTYNFFVELV